MFNPFLLFIQPFPSVHPSFNPFLLFVHCLTLSFLHSDSEEGSGSEEESESEEGESGSSEESSEEGDEEEGEETSSDEDALEKLKKRFGKKVDKVVRM